MATIFRPVTFLVAPRSDLYITVDLQVVSPRHHNHNDVLVSSSRRADDVTCERRREGLYVTIVPLLVRAQLLYNQLSHLDTRHFVIIECRHLANGCVLKCGCIGLMLFHNLSCLDTIICYINTIGIVPAYACNVCDALVASCATTG